MVNRVRYVERKYLCKYDLTEKFFEKLGLEVYDVTPLRKLYILDTNKGKKILKRVEYGIGKIEFIHNAIKYINKKYNNTIKLDIINGDKPYLIWEEDIYILMDAISGREVTFTNEVEVELCGQVLAKFHEAGEGISEYLDSTLKIKTIIKDKKSEYENEIKILKEFYERVNSYQFSNDLDKIFLNNYSNIIEDIEKSISLLKEVDFEAIKNNKKSLVLCHNDLAHHNFLINEGVINLLDFDYSSIDFRAYDIEDFLVKAVKNVAYDVEKGIKALSAYEEVEELDINEIKLIIALITYPKEVTTLILDYYMKRKDWEYEVFLSRIKNKLENEGFRKEFCDKIKEEYKL